MHSYSLELAIALRKCQKDQLHNPAGWPGARGGARMEVLRGSPGLVLCPCLRVWPGCRLRPLPPPLRYLRPRAWWIPRPLSSALYRPAGKPRIRGMFCGGLAGDAGLWGQGALWTRAGGVGVACGEESRGPSSGFLCCIAASATHDAAGLVALWSWLAGDIAAFPDPPASLEEAAGEGWERRRADPAAALGSRATGDHACLSVTSDPGDPGDAGW